MHCCSSPARTGRPPIPSTSRLATTPRSPASAARRATSPSTARSMSYNQCFGPGDCTALVNFWRSAVEPHDQRRGQGLAASSASSGRRRRRPRCRRVHVNGFTTLMDYCTSPSFASGGFIADSPFAGSVVNGSQQQYLVRDSSLDAGPTASGTRCSRASVGAPAQSFPHPPYTTLETNPDSREKPFLYVDANDQLQRLRPDVRFNSTRHDLAERPDAGPCRSRSTTSSSPSRPTASRRSTTHSPRARTSSSPRASTTSTRRSR